MRDRGFGPAPGVVREWRNRTYLVTVTEDGFEH